MEKVVDDDIVHTAEEVEELDQQSRRISHLPQEIISLFLRLMSRKERKSVCSQPAKIPPPHSWRRIVAADMKRVLAKVGRRPYSTVHYH